MGDRWKVWAGYRAGDGALRALLAREVRDMGDGLMTPADAVAIVRHHPRSMVKLRRVVSAELADRHGARLLDTLRTGLTSAHRDGVARSRAQVEEAVRDSRASMMGDPRESAPVRIERPTPRRDQPAPVRHVEVTPEMRKPQPVTPSREGTLYAWRTTQAAAEGLMPDDYIPDAVMRAIVDHHPPDVTSMYSIPGLDPDLVFRRIYRVNAAIGVARRAS